MFLDNRTIACPSHQMCIHLYFSSTDFPDFRPNERPLLRFLGGGGYCFCRRPCRLPSTLVTCFIIFGQWQSSASSPLHSSSPALHCREMKKASQSRAPLMLTFVRCDSDGCLSFLSGCTRTALPPCCHN